MRDRGALAENAVLLKLQGSGPVTYDRADAKEIDFIQDGHAYEVNYRRGGAAEDLRALQDAPFRSKTLLGLEPIDVPEVRYVPLTRFLLDGDT